jgi:hypothetical protein
VVAPAMTYQGENTDYDNLDFCDFDFFDQKKKKNFFF